MKFSPKKLIIMLCSLVVVAAIATTAVVLVNNSGKSKSTYTVRFELCTDLETTAVNDREVEPGAFLEEPEVYVTGQNEENWGIEGWYRDKAYEVQWDFDFDTVESDLTLYAKWAKNPQCTVNFWTLDSDKAIYTAQIRKGLTTARCDDKFIGREVLGYYTDKEMTNEYDFATKVNQNLDLWVKLSDYVYFGPEAIMSMNICGNQVEVSDYEATRSINLDGDIVTIGGKNGAYFWIKDLDLAMNGTSIIQIKARELNNNYNGLLTAFIMGTYTLNGEIGVAGNFGENYTGSMPFGRSSEPDEDGFYTYTYNLSALTPGIVYDKMTGFRFGIVGTDTYSFEVKEIRTLVDEYAVSGDAFLAKDGINFNALHLNTFALMGGAQTEMIGKELLSFGGPNGAYIYRKQLEIGLGEEQIVRVVAKGDLKDGALAMFFYGDYTINGKAGSTTDFTSQHRVTFTAESTDANGYTTYVADISSAISGLKYKTIKGIRFDLYGEGTRTLQLKSVVSSAPSAEEQQIAADFSGKGINFTGAHLNKFLTMGGAEKELLSNGNLKFTGENGAFIYYKNLNNVMGDEQKLRLTAKGDLKNGVIAAFLFGDYTENGKAGSTTDYTAKQRVTFTKEGVTADGYTTYVADLTTIGSNFKFHTIKGLRLDLYGEGSRSIEIQSLKSFAPSQEEVEANEDFVANGIDFTGVHFGQFSTMGDAETELLANNDFSFGGPNGAFIYRKNLKITMGDEQYIRLTAKGDLNNGTIALFFFGKYTENGVTGTTTDYTAEHRVNFIKESTDAEGYTTYLADISSIPGMKYDEIHGLRIDLYGTDTRTIEIKSMKSYVPTAEEATINDAFTANGIHFTGLHFSRFNTAAGAKTNLLANKEFSFGGSNGSYVYKKDMNVAMGEEQCIRLVAKGDLNNGAIALYLFGDYTLNGVSGASTDFGQENTRFSFEAESTDAEGYTTYVARFDEVAGLKYDVIKGIRVDLNGAGTRTIEIQSMDSFVPEPSAEPEEPDETEENPFYLSAKDLDGFNKNSGAVATLTADETVLQMSGTNGSFIHKKGLSFDELSSQTITMTAKASSGAVVAVYMYGDYTENGTDKATTDYGAHYWTLTAGTADSEGYATYTFTVTDKYPAVTYKTIKGFRIEVWGNGSMTLDIKEVKLGEATAQPPTEPEEPEENPFYLSAKDLDGFNKNSGAAATLTADESVLQMSGTNGSFIHKKGLSFDELSSQTITITAKASSGAVVAVYMYGDYTENGTDKATTDYGAHFWTLTAGTADSEGYATYTFTVTDKYPAVTYKTIKGFRIEMWGSGSMTLDIKEVKLGEATTQPPEETEGNPFYLSAKDLDGFNKNSGAVATLTADESVLQMSGTNGSFIHKKGLSFDELSSQTITITAKASSGAVVAVYMYGDYTENGTDKATTDYGAHYWTLTAGTADSEGYATYTFTVTDKYPTVTYKTIKGFRIEMWGNGSMTLDIKEVKVGEATTQPPEETEGNPFYLSAKNLNDFNKNNGAAATLTADESVLQMTGTHGSFIHKKGLSFDELSSQTITMTAKASAGTIVAIYMYGDYTENGTDKTTTDYGTHYWTMTAGTADSEGYATYTFTVTDKYPAVTYKTIKGFRIEVWNGGNMTLDIKEVAVSK